ncbi:BBSome-interacting protein 1-like [Dermacentor silvarum]|uniref:BBSome-interacting protein 1-like n=1 Tax=Dermacentor silvarum TaxID=543639 RepID=UPI00210100C2|nr:BBSome-interacting protein 1-like [Dermacentor silvarum]
MVPYRDAQTSCSGCCTACANAHDVIRPYSGHASCASRGAAVHEVVPSRGLLFRETSAQPVLCKPKLMPLQSISLEKLERLQAQQKTQQQQPPKSH